MRRATATLFFVLLFGIAGVVNAEEAVPTDPSELVLQQLAALRMHDFSRAYTFASRELRRNFTPSEFEWMVKRAHPEVASSDYAFVVRTREAEGYLYVTVKIHGRNGQNVEAIYEMVQEPGGWKVNALSSRRDDGLL